MGLLTAMFAVGQILGPPVVGAIFARQRNSEGAFALALGIASITLVVGAVMLVAMIVMFPARVHHRPQDR